MSIGNGHHASSLSPSMSFGNGHHASSLSPPVPLVMVIMHPHSPPLCPLVMVITHSHSLSNSFGNGHHISSPSSSCPYNLFAPCLPVDKSAGGQVSLEFEEACQKLQDYCDCLGVEVNERINILNMMKESKTAFAYQHSELIETFSVSSHRMWFILSLFPPPPLLIVSLPFRSPPPSLPLFFPLHSLLPVG